MRNRTIKCDSIEPSTIRNNKKGDMLHRTRPAYKHKI